MIIILGVNIMLIFSYQNIFIANVKNGNGSHVFGIKNINCALCKKKNYAQNNSFHAGKGNLHVCSRVNKCDWLF